MSARDPEALSAMLEQYGALVYGLCIAIDPHPDDAYQSAWERILRALPRFDPNGPARMSTWLHRVVHNHLIDRHRRRMVRGHPEPLLEEPTSHDALDEAMERRDQAERLRLALAQLPEPHRRAVVFHHLEGFPVKELAQAEGVPVGTVKSRLHHGRAKLLALLGEAG